MTGVIAHHSHLAPVIAELLAAVEADHVVAGAGVADGHPVRRFVSRVVFRGEWLGQFAVGASDKEDLKDLF